MADTGDTLHLGQIIEETGDFGNFQILMIVYMQFALVILNWSMMTMSYTAAVPDWLCYGSAIGQNETGSWNASNVCEINGTSCASIEFVDDMKTAVSEWQLVCDQKWVSQTITTIQMSGLLAGGLICGHISDGIGRKPTLWIAYFIVGAFNLVSFFSVNWVMFAVMRFGIGFGCACFMSTSISMEYIRNKWRMYLMAIPGWAFCSSLLAVFCWRLQDWRFIHIVIAALTGVYVLSWPLVPESFRWLVTHGRLEEAEKTIRYVAKINRKPAPNLTKLRAAMEYEQKEAEKIKALRVYTVLDLFRTSHIRKTTILFALICFYGSFQGWRRWTCVGFYIVAGVFGLAVGIIKNIEADVPGSMINVLALMAKLCISAAWDLNTLWSMESFPTVVRNIGGGFISSVSRVGSMVAPQIITLGHWKAGSVNNDRKRLYDYWAHWKKFYKIQPLEYIRNYYGSKIAMYFAWLGFYTQMLVLPSIIGLFIFIYGVAYMDDSYPSKEVCDPSLNFTMCPLCDYQCPYWNLHESCGDSKYSRMFDNNGTLFFAIFMSLWGTLFLEFWKRKQAVIQHKWDLTDFVKEESQDIPGLLYILSGVVCVLSSVLCTFLRETKDRDLDDMIHGETTLKTEKENGNIQTVNEKMSKTDKL